MSLGLRIPHADALKIARAVVDDLAPACARLKVAGSLRRMRPYVSDVEIVLEPRPMAADLFGGSEPDVEAVRAVAEQWGRIVKGGQKYIQVETAMQGMKLDLFLVTPPADYWVLLAIRTGPSTLSQWAVSRMHDHGLQCQAGRIIRKSTGETVPCSSEADFFAAAGLPCLPPRLRDTPDALQQVQQEATA